jgi:hypothetical protein
MVLEAAELLGLNESASQEVEAAPQIEY